MASLDKETKQLLIEIWLPRVRDLPNQRKPIFRMMMCALLVPMIVAIALLVWQILTKESLLAMSGLSALVLGIPAIAFVYWGRLQACNDVISVIELTVMLGDREQIIKSISSISCFGKMQDLLRDIRPLLKSEGAK
jgi:hypothetical protein